MKKIILKLTTAELDLISDGLEALKWGDDENTRIMTYEELKTYESIEKKAKKGGYII